MARNADSAHAKKILVTDDNQVILKSLSRTLQSHGYQVFTASGGSETIGTVSHERPDLILLDLNFPPDGENFVMPLQDGFQIMEWLYQMSDARNTPVIIISASDPEEYKARAAAAGVVASFQKPLDKNRLLEVIQATLGAETGNDSSKLASGIGARAG
jgi:CheY-like chemotaxis protein